MWHSNWQEMVRPTRLSAASNRRARSLMPRSSLSHCAERQVRNFEIICEWIFTPTISQSIFLTWLRSMATWAGQPFFIPGYVRPISTTPGNITAALMIEVGSQNDEIAGAAQVSPEGFIGLGTVPLQDPGLASGEVRRAVTELGLAGVEIGTAIEGKNLDDPALEPFWQTCEHVGAAIFVHPAAVLAPERTSKYRMLYSVGYTTETGIAAAAMVMSGLLDRHPNLRICFAHGGGIFPWLLPRLDQTWNVFDDVKAGTPRKPSETAKMLTYDTLTYDTNNLGLLIERVGVDRLVMGTDYPFPLREVPPGVVIDAVHNIRSEEREAMLGQNALRFLRRSSTSTITSS